MFFKILKKDLKRKKAMNIILSLFIILATTLLSGSVSSLLTVMNAVDYFGDVTNVSDYFVISNNDSRIDTWADKSANVKDYESTDVIMLTYDVYHDNKLVDLGTKSLVTTLSKKYNLVVDRNNKQITSIKKGQIIINNATADKNNLSIGDKLKCNYRGNDMEFEVASICKDMVFGSTSMGSPRIIISQEDFEFMSNMDPTNIFTFYSINTDDEKVFAKDLNRNGFPIQTSLGLTMLRSVFVLDMMVSAILSIVSVILIIIALLVLRFTITFTIQEDYKEIGIMKAIGLKAGSIRKIYIAKYVFIALISVIVGIALGIPFSDLMISSIKNNMALQSATAHIASNILCGVGIFVLVFIFCWLCIGKLRKFTAMQAIRFGISGQRFKKKSRISLNKSKKVPTLLFLAFNDIMSETRRYIAMTIVFILGSLLIILPLNSANTLADESLIKMFGIEKCGAFIDDGHLTDYSVQRDEEKLKSRIKELEGVYAEKGVDVELYIDCWFLPSIYKDNKDETKSLTGIQTINYEQKDLLFEEGSVPKEANEVAVSSTVMKEMGLNVGDSIKVIFGGDEQDYIISGSLISMMNMGYTMRFSPKAELNFDDVVSVDNFQGNFKKGANIKENLKLMREATPDYKIRSCKNYAGTLVGSITESIGAIKMFVIILVLLINCLITVLMVKTFLVKDVGGISLMKNLGFSNKSIRIWQMLRILIILIIAIIVSIPLSIPLNKVANNLSFGMMGAKNMESIIKPLEVFVLCPIVLLVGTAISALLSSNGIKKISFKEINNIE